MTAHIVPCLRSGVNSIAKRVTSTRCAGNATCGNGQRLTMSG